ncbi:hypothetical protein AB0L63_03750 [Nocardia sp. NPDC051990]|uniref:hypothetical protein n=1 Tax=Nocardia sp. NPDC051990 TaxID=3155285 RepID=UPI003437C7B1
MHDMLRKALLLTISVLVGIIVGILSGLLTHADGEHLAAAIRDGCVGFASTVTLIVLLLARLGAF